MKKTRLFQLLKTFVLVYVAEWLTPKWDERLPPEIFKQKKLLKISYCTTCMGRTFHLKKTYIKNILGNINYPNIEFILVNFNSNDDMEEWVKSSLSDYIEKGIVKYYRTPDPQNFHMAKAKNLAHRLATGDILVNLDADNFLGKDNAYYTNFYFNKHGDKSVVRFSKKDFRYFDTCGRIALTKKTFDTIRGYREDILPYGEEDLDLISRAKLTGCKVYNVELVNFLRTVKHDNALRNSNLKESQVQDVKSMRKHNHLKMLESVKNNEFMANAQGYTQFTVYENFNAIEKVLKDKRI